MPRSRLGDAAAPQGGQVVSGSGLISSNGTTTTIAQNSPTLSLTWQKFNIASNETVTFVQPSAASIAVNRILDTNGSQIYGHLNANGQVYLINPNWILFGQGAQVNVSAGLMSLCFGDRGGLTAAPCRNEERRSTATALAVPARIVDGGVRLPAGRWDGN